MRDVAERVLAEQCYVRPVDVLVGLGWIAEVTVERWQQGRFDPLESVMHSSSPDGHRTAIAELGAWAKERGLRPEEWTYWADRGHRRALSFGRTDQPEVEQAFRTHWYATDQPAPPPPEPSADDPEKPAELLVIFGRRGYTCTGCATEYGPGSMLIMEDPGPVCLACADLDHLEFLPSGNTALTRRSKKASRLLAVVVEWSRTRRRYERQGILAEADAIAQAEAACLDDQDVRERRRIRDAERRERLDETFVAELATAIRDQFPGCPSARAAKISEHAGLRGSGRVGRSAAGRALDTDAVRLAVVASVRHEDTDYDELLSTGVPRETARARIRAEVDEVIDRWSAAPGR